MQDGEPYIQGQADYLDRAIGWARKHNLAVIVDLHGAPGKFILGMHKYTVESVSKGRRMVMIILEGGVLLTGKF